MIYMTDMLTKHKITFYADCCDGAVTAPVVYGSGCLSNELLDINLAKLCCTLCCASRSEEAIKKAFREMGFFGICSYYYSTPGENTASVCVAKKDKNIFVVIRGTEGEEWYNNFRTGTSDIHQGYKETAENIMPVLKEYINSGCRLLLTGHSRGGALANLISAQLIKSGRRDVFCYTFACPNITADDDVYSSKFRNIYNFIYEDDFVPQFPLSEWGYNRYGCTITFKNCDTNSRRLKKAFKDMTGLEFKTFRDCGQDMSNFKDTALRLASNTEEYYNKGYLVDEDYLTLYDYFLTICDLFNGKNSFEAGITLLATKLSEFAPISEFFVSGMEFTEFINKGSGKNTCAMSAHSCLTYLCLLNTQKIKAP